MKAVLTKSLKSGTKTITGQVIQDGIGRITLAVTEKNGSRNIKGFKKSDYTINYLD
jgi:hypothetical protein